MRHLLIATMVLATFACGNEGEGNATGGDGGDAVNVPDTATETDAETQSDPGLDCGACPADRSHCDPVSGQCAVCVLPSHCAGVGQRCIGGECVQRVPCADDAGCKVLGGVCHEGSCVACIEDAQCGQGRMCRSDHCVPTPKICEEDAQCGEWSCAKSWKQCVQCQDHAGCAASQHCAGGYCVADACEAGVTTCKPGEAQVRLVCSEQGDHVTEVACGTADHVCADGKCVVGVCKPAATTCVGLQRAVCSPNGQFRAAFEDCGAKGMTCKDGKCNNSACEPGVTTCLGGQAATCDALGSAWIKKPCYGGTTCIDGTCTSTVCKVGDLSCIGDSLVECLGGIKTSTVTDCAEQGQVCESGQCVTPFCGSGSKQCQGNVVQVCNSKGTLWSNSQSCSGATPFCSEGQCVNKVCSPGQKKCGGDSILTCAAGNLSWDAQPCPVGQLCGAGPKCVTPICKPPGNPPEAVQKVSQLKTASKIAACDLNGDGVTDNSIATITGLFGDLDAEIAKAVAGGDLILLLQATGWNTTGKTFTVGVHSGTLDSASKGCNLISSIANCGYKVSAKGINVAGQTKGTCPAANALDQSKITGNNLLAQGTKGTVTLPLSFLGAPIPLPMHKLQIKATVSDATSWKTTSNGKLCGAVKVTDFMNAVQGLPDSVFAALPFSKPMVISLLGSLLQADIDTDGDGKVDAYSTAFTMMTVPGKITGLGI